MGLEHLRQASWRDAGRQNNRVNLSALLHCNLFACFCRIQWGAFTKERDLDKNLWTSTVQLGQPCFALDPFSCSLGNTCCGYPSFAPLRAPPPGPFPKPLEQEIFKVLTVWWTNRCTERKRSTTRSAPTKRLLELFPAIQRKTPKSGNSEKKKGEGGKKSFPFLQSNTC